MSSVDVIVPCYRYGHFLEECVTSVLAQSGPSIRVLVIDDASPDNTKEVATELARRDPRVMLVSHASNRGHISTYNEGIEWASADYFLLLSADDYLFPGSLDRAVSLMDTHLELNLCFGNAVELNELGDRTCTDAIPCDSGFRILTASEFILLSGARNIVPTPTAVVRTAVQKHVGGYRTELPHSGDMEMWLRLAAHGLVGFIQRPQAVYRHHGNNMYLSYGTQRWLPDLEQKKAAFDCFFEGCGNLVAGSDRLRGILLRLLAREAISRASAAFNDDQREFARQLCVFARRVYPGIVITLPWAKLVCKRFVGRRMSSLLRAVHRKSVGLYNFGGATSSPQGLEEKRK